MLDVVRGTLGGGIFLGEDQLVAGLAAGYFQLDGQVASTVDLAVVEEVDQVRQQLAARLTLEAARMPGDLLARSLRLDGHLAELNGQATIAAVDVRDSDCACSCGICK